MDDQVHGASVPDRAGQATPGAAEASPPSGDHPSRVDAAKAYVLGRLDERQAISRFLTVRAARAMVFADDLPWWTFRRRQAHWSAVGHAVAAREIEEGKHVTEQAVWVVELDRGFIVGREAFQRDSDRSGEASETHSGSTEGESAGPKDIAQPSSDPTKEPSA